MRIALCVLVCVPALLSLTAWAQSDETCPAGAAGASCRGDELTTDSGPSATRATWSPTIASSAPQVDLIKQELDELADLIKLGQEKKAILKELKAVADAPHGLSSAQARILKADLPVLSPITGEGERMPVATSEDFAVSKTIMEMESPVLSIRFMLLRNQRPSTSSSSSSASSNAQLSMPNCLLVAAQEDGRVKLFSPNGDLLLSFAAGHDQPVTQLAVSPTHEEHLVATGDAGGSIRLHRVNVMKRRVTKEERMARNIVSDEKVSQYLGAQLNVTVQLQRQVQLPPGSDGEVPMLTALALATNKGSRQVVAGDSEGRISVFAKNGTLRGHVDVTAMEGASVEGLHAYHGQLIFRAGRDWGYVNMDKVTVNRIDCPKFEGRVAAVTVDSQQLSKVLLSDEAGSVWIFNVKNKKNCELERRFLPATGTVAPLELASIKGFAIGVQKATDNITSSLLALNMSQRLERRRPGEQEGPDGFVVWRRQGAPVQDWSHQKRQQQGDLVALLSADGREIEILELLMQVYNPPPSSDPFSNMKMPIMGVAVVLILGYQFMKQKGGKGGGGGGGLGGLGALGGRGGGKFGKPGLSNLMNKRGGLGKKRF